MLVALRDIGAIDRATMAYSKDKPAVSNRLR